MQPYNSYLNPAQRASNIQALQSQINYLQSQMQAEQAMMNSAQQIPQQMLNNMPIQQPQQQAQQNGLITKVVKDFDVITANDVPMDGNGAMFIKSDGSEIQVRRWASDGKITPTVYKPEITSQNGQNENKENYTINQENLKLGLSDEVTQAFMQRFDDITSRLDMIEQVWADKKTNKDFE